MRVEGKKLDFDAPVNELFRTFPDEAGVPKKIAQYKGEVGIEIEVEGRNLPRAIPSYWHTTGDGSLRGQESAEYILKQPCARKSVKKFLEYFADQMHAKKAVVDDSPRTSVHVHVNMAKYSLTQAFNYMVLYFIVEDLMQNIAGDSRVGNLFCLRCRDAEHIVDLLAAYAKVRKFNPIPDLHRYASLNVCALTKFNSLEFRALRGTTDPKIINQWVELLLAIKDAAVAYKYPTEILADFSKLGPKKFIEKIFPDDAALFTKQKGYDNIMWDSTRLIQEIVFATAWHEPQKPKRLFDVGNDARVDEDDGDM